VTIPLRLARVLTPWVWMWLVACCTSSRGVPASMLGWSGVVAPLRLVGNIHFVGTNELGIFLVTTPAGHILIDSGFEANVPELRRSVEALGFRFEDIKIVLSSHAHIDHVQAHALVRRLTGARVIASKADAEVIASGGKHEWAYGDLFAWTPCPVDATVEDGGQVELGGTTLVAHLTPGHTRGATTWTTTTVDPEGGPPLHVVFFPSASVPPGARLVGNPAYPTVIADYRHSFALWRQMPCDVFLGPHTSFFDFEAKARRLRAGERPNPFIDPVGYARALAGFEERFEAVVASQS
jgi:metallo-beta-lactamase class B